MQWQRAELPWVLEEKLQGLSIARRSSRTTYLLLHVALQPTRPAGSGLLNFTIHLHNKDTLSLMGDILGHSGPLCGAEQINEEDSFLVFWDIRKPGGGLLGVYSESHSDDITQVCFHPRDKDRLASGSRDGLVNVFDLSRGAEEEALLATCDSDSSVGSVCWSGADYTQLLCLSHDEGLHLWDLGQLDTEEPLTILSTSDARSLTLLADGGGVDYLVGGRWLEETQKLLVVGGKNSGDLHLMECDNRGAPSAEEPGGWPRLHGALLPVGRCRGGAGHWGRGCSAVAVETRRGGAHNRKKGVNEEPISFETQIQTA
ncbi:WD repeat-containing protein 89 [Lates japonicus]|uniref:WD repeat-containing protein 89 n=1 Tax=Lates japonicus TaxID=270547 RepID=A0AAD3M4R3_LATJO|nr:WD repeat-containing protein 89 [Lates japonicus]